MSKANDSVKLIVCIDYRLTDASFQLNKVKYLRKKSEKRVKKPFLSFDNSIRANENTKEYPPPFVNALF